MMLSVGGEWGFSCRKCATKFLCVNTISGKVVRHLTVPEIWRVPKISKVRHVTPSRPLTRFGISFVSITLGDKYARQI